MLFQKIKRYPTNAFSMIALCFLMLFVPASSNANPPIADMDYSGEELFEGIYFARGPVAQNVELLQYFDLTNFVTDPGQQNDIINFQNQVMAVVSQDHAAFLEALRSAVASRNKYKIKQELFKGYEIIKDVVASTSEQQPSEDQQELFRSKLEQEVDLNTASAEEIKIATQNVIEQAQGVCLLIPIVLPLPPIYYIYVIVFVDSAIAHPEGLFQEQLIDEISKL